MSSKRIFTIIFLLSSEFLLSFSLFNSKISSISDNSMLSSYSKNDTNELYSLMNNLYLDSNFIPIKSNTNLHENNVTTQVELDDFIDIYNSFNDKLYSNYNCVLNSSSKQVVYGNNLYDAVPNASTTKILTCILALENSNTNDVVTFSQYACSMPKVALNVKPGYKFKLSDLLYSLMLESHNDTAVAIAEHVAGSVEAFANLMNAKAKELNCINSHFVTPNGLDNDLHYSCAYDLCLIASYALKNEQFKRIISKSTQTIQELTTHKKYTLNNHDNFLDLYDNAIGIKTGYTSKAGYCFVGAIEYNNNIYTSAVLACGWPPHKDYKWHDTTNLMNYIKKHEIRYKVSDTNKLNTRLKNYLDEKSNIKEKYEIEIKLEPITYSVTNNKIKYHIFENENNIKISICDGENILTTGDILLYTQKKKPHYSNILFFMTKQYLFC